jgi:hypothetical protein
VGYRPEAAVDGSYEVDVDDLLSELLRGLPKGLNDVPSHVVCKDIHATESQRRLLHHLFCLIKVCQINDEGQYLYIVAFLEMGLRLQKCGFMDVYECCATSLIRELKSDGLADAFGRPGDDGLPALDFHVSLPNE